MVRWRRLKVLLAGLVVVVGIAGWAGLPANAAEPPTAPTVTATYQGAQLANCLEQTVCPEIVVFDDPVTFTFTTSSPDVVRYRYGFIGEPAQEIDGSSITLDLRPPEEGWVRLDVQAINSDGQFSTTTAFLFNVAPAPGPVGSWAFDDGSGTTAADGSGNAHALALNGGAALDGKGRLDGSLALDGVDDYAQASDSVVDTSQSFTVSAWARPTSSTKLGVVAAADGTNSSAFGLGYDPSTKRWVFARTSADTRTPTLYRASSAEAPVNGAWSHLLASYDASAGELKLFVNGRLQQTTAFPIAKAWKATGQLTVGSGLYAGATGGSFAGSLDHVQVWQRVLRANEITALQDPRINDRVASGIAARWPLDSAVRGSDRVWRTPETVRGADLSVSGFGTDQSKAFVDDPERGKVLELTGAARESVSLTRPVIDGSASFSVAVWVKIGDLSKPMVIARQGTTAQDAWRLSYQPLDQFTGQYRFARGHADGSTETVAVSTVDRDSLEGWHLLIGSYNRTGTGGFGNPDGRIELTVDNRGSDGGQKAYSAPTRTGSTIVGAAATKGAGLIGRLDELRVYAGVLSQSKACTEFPELDGCGS
ncbi:LamG domain-containing protein [Kribbella sp. NBC_00359]|uniref:LamG domain-containing protein n=1 Tax=Kribbella sp. NBC_00359 TaxID=2975966 RepID=UPI002E22990F